MSAEKSLKEKLYVIIFEAETRLGRLFDVVLLWAIILSVLCIILESDDAIGAQFGTELRVAEWLFTVLFSAEYVLRIFCAKKEMKYPTSFFGIVDFVSIIPTYLSLFIAGTHYLLVLRAIRLLRIFRVLKLARYLQESQVLMKALVASRAKITVFLGGVLTIVLIVGTLMHMVEQGNPGFSSIFKGMYWSVVTMTTVGYGDIVPQTHLGQLLASFVMIMGYGIIAVPTGIVSAEITNATRDSRKNLTCGECSSKLLAWDSKFCHKCGVEVKS